MPRKHREVRAALTRKGFEENAQTHHVFLFYRDRQGRLTGARTKLSHASGGEEVSDSLLGQMARQVGLARAEFLRLVDCPMSREDYERGARL